MSQDQNNAEIMSQESVMIFRNVCLFVCHRSCPCPCLCSCCLRFTCRLSNSRKAGGLGQWLEALTLIVVMKITCHMWSIVKIWALNLPLFSPRSRPGKECQRLLGTSLTLHPVTVRWGGRPRVRALSRTQNNSRERFSFSRRAILRR